MRRFSNVKKLLRTKAPKKTDDLGLCNVVYKVPEPYYPGLMRVIERVE